VNQRAVTAIVLLSLAPRARAAETFEDWAYYVGDPHTHTGVSTDGGSSDFGTCKSRKPGAAGVAGDCGSFYDVFDNARAQGLDWIAVTDHTNGKTGNPLSDAAGYQQLTQMAIDAHDPEGGFVTLPAGEVWIKTFPEVNLGHLSFMMFGENEDLELMEMSDLQPTGTEKVVVADCAAVGTWFEAVEATFGPVIGIPHHPASTLPMPTDWSCNFPKYQPAVEVYSEHGQSLTDDTGGFDPMWSGPVSAGTVTSALDPDGYALRLGFMAGSDRHDSRPGEL
jgi:hypothetical protein